MSDSAWVLKGVDAETRRQAAEEAERRGMSVADYLTDVVLQRVLAAEGAAEDGDEHAEPDETDAETEFEAAPAPQADPAYPTRHRLEALERRLALSVSGLDGAVNALDASVYGIAARVDQAQGLAQETADALDRALADIQTALKVLRSDVASAESDLDDLGEANAEAHASLEAKHTDLEQRLASTDEIARAAERTGADLIAREHAFRRTVAEDFATFATDCDTRLTQELAELRAASEDAAHQADAAAQRLATDMRLLRDSLAQQVADNAADIQARVETAFADGADLYAALNDRVNESERTTGRAIEQTRLRLMDVEEAAQAALEAAAESLRAEHGVLAAEQADTRAQFSEQLGSLREDQRGTLARLKLVDSAATNTISDLSALRDEVGKRLAETAEQTDRVHRALSSDLERVELGAIASLTKLSGDIDTASEAATAALVESRGHLSAYIGDVRTTLADDIAQTRTTLTDDITHTRATLTAEIADTRDQAAGALARLRLIDQAIGAQGLITALEAGAPTAAERLTRLEAELASRLVWLESELPARMARLESELPARLVRLESELPERLARLDESRARNAAAIMQMQASAESDRAQAAQLLTQLTALTGQIAQMATQQDGDTASLALLVQQVDEHAQALTHRVDEAVIARIDDLKARLSVQENLTTEAADRVHGIARMLGRVTAQSADASGQSEERLHKLELALADLRLEHISSPGAPGQTGDAAAIINDRFAELEQQQSTLFHDLRNDIALFVGDNERRIAALEAGGDPQAVDRLGAAFEALHRRVEERVLQVETKTIHGLEQVMESVALVSRKFKEAAETDDETVAKSA